VLAGLDTNVLIDVRLLRIEPMLARVLESEGWTTVFVDQEFGDPRDVRLGSESLRRWVKQSEIDAGERERLSTDKREELNRLRRENRILKQEREFLKKRPSSSRRRMGLKVSCYRLIEAERTNFFIPLMYRMLKVSKIGYYDWKARPPSMRSTEDAALTEKIRETHGYSRGTYGSPRVHAELKSVGVRCGKKRVARLMREAELHGSLRGHRRSTTCRNIHVVPAEDLVKRNFAISEVDRLWVADITYVHTDEDFLYLAFVLDVCSRRVVGWTMEAHLRTELVVDALGMSLWRRKPDPGLILNPVE
jgi:hypothetical protein